MQKYNTKGRKTSGLSFFFGGKGIKKKKGIYPRHPIFINLKSNTMKNTVQMYVFYVI